MSGRLVGGVGLLLGLTTLVACMATPRESGSALIAFTSRRDGWFSIYSVRADGSGIQKMVDIVTVEDGPQRNWLDVLGQPAWSSDGKKIAFVCAYKGQSEICVANADGSHAAVITADPAGPDREPAWSPDGSLIAFMRFIDHSHANIMVVEANDLEVRALTTGSLDGDPVWSPDGKRIAFVRDRDGQSDVFVMNADGTDLRPLTDSSPSEGMLAWSPNGRLIAYVVGSQGQDIYVMDADGSDPRNLTRSSDNEAWPTWSSDGTRLAFMCGPASGICVMNADGSARRQIVDGSVLNMQPAWQPSD